MLPSGDKRGFEEALPEFGSKEEVAAVTAAIHVLQAAIDRGDWTTIEKMIGSSYRHQGRNGHWHDRDDWLLFLRRWQQRRYATTLVIETVSVVDGAAVVIGFTRRQIDGTAANADVDFTPERFLQVWESIEGMWLRILSRTSPVNRVRLNPRS